VERAANRVGHVVNLVGQVQAIARLDGGRLRQPGIVDIVGRPPGIVDPVRRDFQHVMGVVQVVIEHQSALIREPRELADSVVIPGVEARQVIPAEPIGGGSRSTALPGHLVERSPHIRVGPRNGRVFVAPAVVPQSGNRLEKRCALRRHARGQCGQIFGEPRAGSAGTKRVSDTPASSAVAGTAWPLHQPAFTMPPHSTFPLATNRPFTI